MLAAVPTRITDVVEQTRSRQELYAASYAADIARMEKVLT
jgi:hypothetical protein